MNHFSVLVQLAQIHGPDYHGTLLTVLETQTLKIVTNIQ